MIAKEDFDDASSDHDSWIPTSYGSTKSFLNIEEDLAHLIMQEMKTELQHQVQTTQYQIPTSMAMLDLVVGGNKIYYHFNVMMNLTPLPIKEFKKDMKI